MRFTIRGMMAGDVDALARAFAAANKPRDQFARYLVEHERGDRVTVVAAPRPDALRDALEAAVPLYRALRARIFEHHGLAVDPAPEEALCRAMRDVTGHPTGHPTGDPTRGARRGSC